MLIYHVALADDWAAAQDAGEYRVSTRGRSLDDEGFVHCSFQYQIEQTIRLFYADVIDRLVVLAIDEDAVEAEILVENVGDNDEGFPHVYGPIPVAAVVSAAPYER